METFKNHLLNTRPYSWVDLVLLGYVAKFSFTKAFDLSSQDLWFIVGLIFLWFFLT